jgi:hypothetical protein
MHYISSIRRHPSWFFAACVVIGLGMSRLPFLTEPNGNLVVGRFVATYLLAGLLAGALVPYRPWRWGVAMVVAEPVVGVFQQALSPAAVAMGFVLMPVMAIKALPIIAGAYVGRSLVLREQAVEKGTAPPHGAGTASVGIRPAFLACWAVSGAAGLGLRDPWLFGAWLASAVAFSAFLTLSTGLKPFRSAGVAIIGTFFGFVVSLVRDGVFGGPSHNLLPFEMLLVGLVAFPAASVAAWIAFGLQRWFERTDVP